MTTQNDKTETGAVVLHSWTQEREDLLKRTICKGATPDEFALFLGQCKRTGLDPFAKQVHAVKRYDSKLKMEVMSIQTGIDGFRLIAQRTGDYEGQTKPEWCGTDGTWQDVWLAEKPPVAARVGVYRKNFRDALYAVALWTEYAQYFQDNGQQRLTRFWQKMGALMLSKCAEALALRKAYPQELSGLYTTDEMAQADNLRSAEHPAPQRASDPAHTTAATDADVRSVPAEEPSQAPGPATGPSSAPAPAPEPPAANPQGAETQFEDTVSRGNAKAVSGGRTKYGICSGSNRWVNTFDTVLAEKAKRLAGTNIRATFVVRQTQYGLDLLDLIEIPPSGVK